MTLYDDITLGLLDEAPNAQRYSRGNSLVHQKIVELIPERAVVLDVGCGSGELALMIQKERNAKVIGIESNAERAAKAKSNGIDVYNLDFGFTIPKDIGQFDVVIFADVLEHMVSPGAALSITKALLRPQGIIIASIPNVAYIGVRIRLLFGKFKYQESGLMDATHLRWFTLETIRLFFKRLDYRIESVYYIQPPMPKVKNIWKQVFFKLKRILLQTGIFIFPKLFSCNFIIVAKKF